MRWEEKYPVAEVSEPRLGAAVWRFRYPVAAAGVLGAVLAVAASLALSSGAVATTTVALTVPGAGSVLLQSGTTDASLTRYTEQRADFMRSDPVLQDALTATGDGRSPALLRRDVTAEPVGGSNSIRLRVEAQDAAAAVELSDAVVAAYRERTREASVERSTQARDALDANVQEIVAQSGGSGAGAFQQQAAAESLSVLQQRSATIDVERELFDDGVEFVLAASPDSVESPGIPAREGLVGLLIGLVVATVLAWLRADQDRRLVGAPEISAFVGSPLLGEVELEPEPLEPEALVNMPSAPFRASMPSVLSRLRSGVVFLASVQDDESRSATALNIAMAAAREGRSVVLVDADLEHRTISSVVRRESLPGTGDVLLTEPAGQRLPTTVLNTVDGGRVVLLAAGSAAAAASVVPSVVVESLLSRLRVDADLVLVDGAPPTSSPLSVQFAQLADQVLVVVHPGVAERLLTRLQAQLSLGDTQVVGWLLVSRLARRRAPLKPPAVPFLRSRQTV